GKDSAASSRRRAALRDGVGWLRKLPPRWVGIYFGIEEDGHQGDARCHFKGGQIRVWPHAGHAVGQARSGCCLLRNRV
ncbi:hypothetical protein HDU96_001425, partial [Phlyctochytrium bullatum]